MKKSTLVPLIIFLLLAGGLYYFLSTVHLDVFSGQYTRFDELYQKDTVITVANISLVDVSEGRASLDGKSWGIALAIIVLFPLLVAMIVRRRIKRRERKRQAAIHASYNSPVNETIG